ncbi:MAG: LysR family transcriptional regulator [Verrucomicrobiota bacterium]
MKYGQSGHRLGNDIDMRHLRYFVTVASEGSISRAARKLYTSQPSLGRQIRDLESRLGFSLFDRKNRSFTLTRAGNVLFDDSRKLLEQWEEWKEEVATEADKAPDQFRLVVSEYLGGSLVFAEYLQALQKASNNVPIRVIDRPEEPSASEILEGDADFTLTMSEISHRNIASLKIGKAQLCAYLPGSHPLADQESVSLEEIAELPMVQCDPAAYPQVNGAVEAFFSQQGFTQNVEYEVSRVSTAFDLVASGAACFLNFGLGYQALGRDFVCKHIEGGTKVYIYLSWVRERIERTASDLVSSLTKVERARGDDAPMRGLPQRGVELTA